MTNIEDVCCIRAARGFDAGSIARVHIESSGDAYAPFAKSWPEPDWERKVAYWQSHLAQAQSSRVDLVAEAHGELVGFISGGGSRQAGVPAEVEVYVIHVLPQYRGTGIGSRLWSDACGRIRGERLTAMCVATLAELPCCAFYEHRGGVVARRSARMFHGAPATDVIYTWKKGRSHEVTPADAASEGSPY